jgi:hypothetical protein
MAGAGLLTVLLPFELSTTPFGFLVSSGFFISVAVVFVTVTGFAVLSPLALGFVTVLLPFGIIFFTVAVDNC